MTKKLTEQQQHELVTYLVKRHKAFKQINANLYDDWKGIDDAFLAPQNHASTSRFAGLVPFIKESHQTLISHFWARTLQSQGVFFDVQGQDEQAEKFAQIHKHNIWNILYKDGVPNKLDTCLFEHGIKKGFAVARIKYKKVVKEMALPTKYVNLVQNPVSTKDIKSGITQISQTIWDGASLEILDPFHFTYDPSEEWDNGFKCYESWRFKSDLKGNKLFDKNKLELCHPDDSDIAHDDNKPADYNRATRQNKINIKEFYGNFMVGDELLENYYVVIGSDDVLLCCEPNPIYINPFVKWEYNYSKIGMGVSPLQHALDLSNAASNLMNSGVESAKLAINPPLIGPKGAFPNNKKYYLEEGQVIEYEPNPMAPHPPAPLQINPQAPLPYLQWLETQTEFVTGATRQLSGQVTTSDKDQTATEFQGLQVVGNLILDRVVDLFNHGFKLPIIEKMVQVQAIFNPMERQIPVVGTNGTSNIEQVDAQSYFANYAYTIIDSKSEQERKGQIQQKAQFLQMLMQDPELSQRLKKIDIASALLQDFGYGDAGEYFYNDEDFIAENAKKLMEQSIIQTLAQQLAQQTMQNPQLMQQIMQGAQLNGTPINVPGRAEGGPPPMGQDPFGRAVQTASGQPQSQPPIPGPSAGPFMPPQNSQ
jgi:hypothetical protein